MFESGPIGIKYRLQAAVQVDGTGKPRCIGAAPGRPEKDRIRNVPGYFRNHPRHLFHNLFGRFPDKIKIFEFLRRFTPVTRANANGHGGIARDQALFRLPEDALQSHHFNQFTFDQNSQYHPGPTEGS